MTIELSKVAKKPGILEKPGIWEISKKKVGLLNNFYMLSSKISIWHKKSIVKILFFCHYQKFCITKNTFKEALKYLLDFVIIINTVFYLKLNSKLKIGPKTCNLKTWRKFAKNIWQPCLMSLTPGKILRI